MIIRRKSIAGWLVHRLPLWLPILVLPVRIGRDTTSYVRVVHL